MRWYLLYFGFSMPAATLNEFLSAAAATATATATATTAAAAGGGVAGGGADGGAGAGDSGARHTHTHTHTLNVYQYTWNMPDSHATHDPILVRAANLLEGLFAQHANTHAHTRACVWQ